MAALDRVSTSPEVAVALTEAARTYERSLDKDVCLERMRELVGAVGERGGP